MKKIIISCIILLFCASISSAQNKSPNTTESHNGWHRQYVGTDDGFRFVKFFDKNTGWICGNAGSAFHSTDGGETWKTFTPPAEFSYVYFQDDNTGYAVGNPVSNFKLIITHDKGKTWSDPVDFMLYGYRDMVVFGDTINMMSDQQIVRSSDGGKTWKLEAGLTGGSRMRFADSQHGYALGDAGYFHYTINGGINWIKTNITVPYVLLSVFPLSKDTIFVVGEQDYIGFNTEGGRQFTPWTTAYKTLKDTINYDICFSDQLHGFVTGAPGIIKKSTDGGKTWFNQASSVEYLKDTSDPVFMRRIFALDSLTAWAVGDGGILIHTTDGGGVNSVKEPSLQTISSQVYPQPSSGDVTLRYSLPTTDKITISITSINGSEVRTLMTGILQNEGEHLLPINLRSSASGQYQYSITGKTYHSQGSIIIVK